MRASAWLRPADLRVCDEVVFQVGVAARVGRARDQPPAVIERAA